MEWPSAKLPQRNGLAHQMQKQKLQAAQVVTPSHEADGTRRKNLRMQVQPLRVSCTWLITRAVLHFAPRAFTALIGWFRTLETTSDVSSSLIRSTSQNATIGVGEIHADHNVG